MFSQVRGKIIAVDIATDRLCFATIYSEGSEHFESDKLKSENQIEIILKLRDGFLSLADIATARELLQAARISTSAVEIDGFPERLLGVADHESQPVISHAPFHFTPIDSEPYLRCVRFLAGLHPRHPLAVRRPRGRVAGRRLCRHRRCDPYSGASAGAHRGVSRPPHPAPCSLLSLRLCVHAGARASVHLYSRQSCWVLLWADSAGRPGRPHHEHRHRRHHHHAPPLNKSESSSSMIPHH